MSVHLRVSIVGTVLRVSWSSRHHSLGRYVFTSLLVVTSLRVSQFERCHVSHSRNVITCLTVGTLLRVLQSVRYHESHSRHVITILILGRSYDSGRYVFTSPFSRHVITSSLVGTSYESLSRYLITSSTG